MGHPKSMDEMKAAARGAGGMECPKCGCRHLLSQASDGKRGKTYRYRRCRNCGHKVFTREEILRDVQTYSDDEDILPPKERILDFQTQTERRAS